MAMVNADGQANTSTSTSNEHKAYSIDITGCRRHEQCKNIAFVLYTRDIKRQRAVRRREPPRQAERLVPVCLLLFSCSDAICPVDSPQAQSHTYPTRPHTRHARSDRLRGCQRDG